MKNSHLAWMGFQIEMMKGMEENQDLMAEPISCLGNQWYHLRALDFLDWIECQEGENQGE